MVTCAILVVIRGSNGVHHDRHRALLGACAPVIGARA
jgi:hypothetical protein